MEDARIVEAAKQFKEALCSNCPNVLNNKKMVPFSDAILVRSIREIGQMMSLDTISPDVRVALEWVTYKRETI